MVIDSLDEDGYFKATFDELAALLPKEHDVLPEEFAAALKLVQTSIRRGSRRARSTSACVFSWRTCPPTRRGAMRRSR